MGRAWTCGVEALGARQVRVGCHGQDSVARTMRVIEFVNTRIMVVRRVGREKEEGVKVEYILVVKVGVYRVVW
jgi:hypothetical protein